MNHLVVKCQWIRTDRRFLFDEKRKNFHLWKNKRASIEINEEKHLQTDKMSEDVLYMYKEVTLYSLAINLLQQAPNFVCQIVFEFTRSIHVFAKAMFKLMCSGAKQGFS